MPTDNEAQRRKWREDILLKGDFNATFFNQTRRMNTDLAMILDEIQQFLTVTYEADLDPIPELRRSYPGFFWTHWGRSYINDENDLVAFAKNQDYIFLKYYGSSWRYGLVGAKSREPRIRLSICCGQEEPNLWEPLPQFEFVTITNMPTMPK